ncbi:hypothetical protein [Persephonella sp. KM09-Lau-8]|uniref:hypothetical protein n=1 Tax=Persephonella sp. KM09-Lau-8 TaxID=1158345 RepID=UPI0018CC0A08|nr:hypothetical protein [Persephonella sp. KM09-Lau-8]
MVAWLNIVYSWVVESSELEPPVPSNKCVQLAKIVLENKKTVVTESKSEEKPKVAKVEIPENLELNINLSDILDIDIQPEGKRFLDGILVVGDSLGEGLYLEYIKHVRKEHCFKNIKFFVAHSTTTYKWMSDKDFLEELKKPKYKLLLVVLGANQWKMDRVSMLVSVKKFYKKIHKINPNIDIYWVVPAVKNENLKLVIEDTIGKDRTIAMDEFIDEIPLKKDRIHPSIKKGGYKVLWKKILERLKDRWEIVCKS